MNSMNCWSSWSSGSWDDAFDAKAMIFTLNQRRCNNKKRWHIGEGERRGACHKRDSKISLRFSLLSLLFFSSATMVCCCFCLEFSSSCCWCASRSERSSSSSLLMRSSSSLIFSFKVSFSTASPILIFSLDWLSPSSVDLVFLSACTCCSSAVCSVLNSASSLLIKIYTYIFL